MKKREKSPCQVEFSEEIVELVNDGFQQQRHTYQLQNRGPGSVRVRAAIGADSDPVSRPSPRVHKSLCLRTFGHSDGKALSYKPVLGVVSCRCLFC